MVRLATVGTWWVLVVLLFAVGPLLRSIAIVRPRALGRLRYRRWWERDVELERVTDELQARISQIESLESRVSELESRLDFAERLLAGAAHTGDRRSPAGLPQAAP